MQVNCHLRVTGINRKWPSNDSLELTSGQRAYPVRVLPRPPAAELWRYTATGAQEQRVVHGERQFHIAPSRGR